VDWWWHGWWIGGGLVVTRLRVLAVEWQWWLSGGRTSGGGGQITTSLLVVWMHQGRCHLSRTTPLPAAAPPPAAPSLVSTLMYLAVWTRCHLCLSCHRASSRCSIVISVVIDVVVVGLDVDVIGGFDASSKPFIPTPCLLPLLRPCCHCCCRHPYYHCCHSLC
jgi:hypothetical protein